MQSSWYGGAPGTLAQASSTVKPAVISVPSQVNRSTMPVHPGGRVVAVGLAVGSAVRLGVVSDGDGDGEGVVFGVGAVEVVTAEHLRVCVRLAAGRRGVNWAVSCQRQRVC